MNNKTGRKLAVRIADELGKECSRLCLESEPKYLKLFDTLIENISLQDKERVYGIPVRGLGQVKATKNTGKKTKYLDYHCRKFMGITPKKPCAGKFKANIKEFDPILKEYRYWRRIGCDLQFSEERAEIFISCSAHAHDRSLKQHLAEFFKDCRDRKLKLTCLENHQGAINKLIAEQFSPDKLHQPTSDFFSDSERGTSIPDYDVQLVHGSEKWLDPYNVEEITFVARSAELEKLNQFVTGKGEFKIWAVEGSSGAGKTRLTIEWINRSAATTLKGWRILILHKQDRNNPEYWSDWLPSKDTLIIIDYTFGFESVITNLVSSYTRLRHEDQQVWYHNVRLLLLDHVFSSPLHSDQRWGLSVDRSSLNRNESIFYDLKPLNLQETQDQETVIRGIISQRAKIDSQSEAVSRAVEYLKDTPGSWHPLFAALAGDALKSGQDFTNWNRRELIDYYLADRRLPWKLDDKLVGRWAGYFIAVATARRGVAYRDMIDAASTCHSSPDHFGAIKKLCRQTVTHNHPTILVPFVPDIFGESFFLLLLKELENTRIYGEEFRIILLSGDEDTQFDDAIQFLSFIDRLTRNLSYEKKDDEDVLQFWNSLFEFLQPSKFPKGKPLRWAINGSILYLLHNAEKNLSKEEKRKLLAQVDFDDLSETQDNRLLNLSVICAMQYFEIAIQLESISPSISDKMVGLFNRNYGYDSGDYSRHPLFIAITQNFLHTVELLISRGESARTTLKNGTDAFTLACSAGHIKTVKLLLNRGANVNAPDQYGFTPLMWASFSGNIETIYYLLKQGAEINAVGRDKVTALILASMQGQTAAVDCLLNQGADIGAFDKTKCTAFGWACTTGYKVTAELLLDRGANINDLDCNGSKPLSLASYNGHTETVDLLLAKGANINASNDKGETALIAASWQGCSKTVECLVDFGAKIDALDNDGFTALSSASFNGHIKTVELLLKKGANIEAVSYSEISALGAASLNGHTEVVEWLLARGANIDAVTQNRGMTALMMACYNGHTETVERLLAKGASIDLVNDERVSALMAASSMGHTQTVEKLLEWRANVEAVDVRGWSAKTYASENAHADIIKLLSIAMPQ
ncbi:MAG: ankyrin repeat domain-containing protein [Candidatus Thiodiazotropha endolucinida]|nr:ankyrin repeat domain-containing protein [Candidatus Thiodiazotropha endolucinida]